METNKYRAVPIEIGGKFYSFRYDFNALVALEEALGTPDVDFRRLGFKGQRALVWAGLRDDKGNSLTLLGVGDLLGPYLKDSKRYGEIMETAAKAYGSAFPDAPKDEEPDSKNVDATPGAGT